MKFLKIFLCIVLPAILCFNLSNQSICRFKPGYYTRYVGPGIGTIHVEIGKDYLNAHRKIDVFYVENSLRWKTDCIYELTTATINDPILEDVDWVGNKTECEVKSVTNRTYHVRCKSSSQPYEYVYSGPKFPR